MKLIEYNLNNWQSLLIENRIFSINSINYNFCNEL